MSNSVYTVNKGINRALEFRGLKAQYIGYLAVGLVGLLIGFAVLYIVGVPPYLCIGLALGGGGFLFHKIYQFSKRYGPHGAMKKMATRRVPKVLVSRTRRVFMLSQEKQV